MSFASANMRQAAERERVSPADLGGSQGPLWKQECSHGRDNVLLVSVRHPGHLIWVLWPKDHQIQNAAISHTSYVKFCHTTSSSTVNSIADTTAGVTSQHLVNPTHGYWQTSPDERPIKLQRQEHP